MQVRIKKKNRIKGEIRRLQAMISANEYGISKVAIIYRITRTTLMKWIGNLKKKVLLGLQYSRGEDIKNEEYKEKIKRGNTRRWGVLVGRMMSSFFL